MRHAGTRRPFGGLFVLTVALAGTVRGHAEEPSFAIGTRVVARPGTVLQEGDRPIPAARLYRVYRVEQRSGDWLEVSAADVRGWVVGTELIPCDRGVELLTNEIEAHPGRGSLYVLRGLIYQTTGEPRIALADYNEAIRLDPADAAARLLRADLLASVKHAYDRALADYDEAVRLDPKLVVALIHRGDAWMAKGDPKRALQDYDRAIGRDAGNALAYRGRGHAWVEKGDLGRAIDNFLEAVNLRPDDVAAQLDLGRAWYAKNDFERALGNFTEALRLEPTSVLAHNERGRAWAANKNYEQAIADHTQAIRLAPADAAAYVYRGMAWWNLRQFGRAKSDYDAAIRLNPALAEAHNVRAWLHATCPDEKLRDGKAAYDSAVQACTLTNWSTARDLDTLAASCAESGDFVRAAEWEKKAIQLAADADAKTKYRARLELYLLKKPYRESSR